jgi:lysine 2,3-aminomutase
VEAGDPAALERQHEYYDPVHLLPPAGQDWWRARAGIPAVAAGLRAVAS